MDGDQAMGDGFGALTEKEKQTLRLLLAGHDAKSMARHFGLSVHTINERLRDARRKLSVSSSKEAARLLRQREERCPESVGDEGLRGACAEPEAHDVRAHPTPRSTRFATWAIGGIAMIITVAALLALSEPAPLPPVSEGSAQSAATESAIVAAARSWLALVDAGRWSESFAATGQSFRTLNSVETWRAASEKARVPLGPTVVRTLVDERDVPAPPNGYRMVRFHTDFANRRGATETLSLDREGDSWKVVGIYIE